MKYRSFIRIAIALAALWAAPYTAAQTPVNSYTVVEAGPYYALNDAGNLVGEYSPDEWSTRACLIAGGVFTDVGSLGGLYSIAVGVNNLNQVVGYSSLVGEEDSHAFLWDTVTGMRDLGTLGGQNSWADSINDAGQVVGGSNTASGSECAFLWQDDQMVALPIPLGFVHSSAHGINSSGQIVGMVYDANWAGRPFLWTPTVPNGTVGSMVVLDASTYGQANGTNSAGDVVGLRGGQAALWAGAGGPVFSLPGTSGAANSINDSGTVVGSGSFPFVWDPVNGTRDLNKMADLLPGDTLHNALAVNASGQILAARLEYSSYLLTPSPIPSRPFDLVDSGAAGLSLSWTASYGAAGYNVKRWSGTSYTTVATVTAATYNNSSVPDGEANLYVVSAVNPYGESRDSEPAISQPAPPTNLTAVTGKGKGTISLKWGASPTTGINNYRVYRSTTGRGPYSLRASVSGNTTFTDTGLISRTNYYYVVTAVNFIGKESGYSNQASAKTR
jgi:probable HAF family extracellular repeat protein